MSRVLFLEPVGGISGDMALAALLDVGAPFDALAAGLDRLGVSGFEVRRTKASKCGIGGTRVEVVLDGTETRERSWSEIRELLLRAGLPKGARERALSIFERIAVAEAHIHGTTPDLVHFHEVGAVDSIVDVAGVALCLDELGCDRVHALPPPLGTGVVQSRHGPIPVPAPATLELLRGRPVLVDRHGGGPGERTTPTGAAILAACTIPGPPGSFVPERVGYGIGHKDFPDAANVLRATVGREEASREALVVLEANLDDASPQALARALEATLEAGALDAWIAPITMKKGRPGHLVGVLCRASDRARLAEVLFRETPTLGVRHHEVGREALERRFDPVPTRFGEIPVKVGLLGGAVRNAAPEWDACVEAAKRHGVAAREVREEALAAWLSSRR